MLYISHLFKIYFWNIQLHHSAGHWEEDGACLEAFAKSTFTYSKSFTFLLCLPQQRD